MWVPEWAFGVVTTPRVEKADSRIVSQGIVRPVSKEGLRRWFVHCRVVGAAAVVREWRRRVVIRRVSVVVVRMVDVSFGFFV